MTLEELKHKSKQYYYIIDDGKIKESLGYSADICAGNKVMDLDNLVAIPDNATNGDVIKALFPNVEVTHNGFLIDVELEAFGFTVEEDWWNVPYRVKSEE